MAKAKKRLKYFIEVPGIFPRARADGCGLAACGAPFGKCASKFPGNAPFEMRRIEEAPNLYAVLRVLPAADVKHVKEHYDRLWLALATAGSAEGEAGDDSEADAAITAAVVAVRARVRFAGEALVNPVKRTAYDLWRWLAAAEEEDATYDHELYDKWLAVQKREELSASLQFLLAANGWRWVPAGMLVALALPVLFAFFAMLLAIGMVYAAVESLIPEAFGVLPGTGTLA